MATKKSKHKIAQQITVTDLLKRAEDQLRSGQAAQAIETLTQAEAQLRKYRPSGSAKKISIPPHIVAAQIAFTPLLARALFEYSFTIVDPKNRSAKIDEAAKLMPGDARYGLARAACRVLLGELEMAQSDFRQAIERWPENALASRASVFLATSAQAEFAAAGSSLGGRFSPSLSAGLKQLAAGEREAAREHLNNLPQLDHNPTRAEAASLATQLFYSGVLQFNAGNFKEAVSDFKGALHLVRGHAMHLPWCERLQPYYHQIAENIFENDLLLAIECWQEALLLVPNDKVAAGNLAMAKQAQARGAWRAGDIEQAAALWQETLSFRRDDDRLVRSLAVAYDNLGRKNEALVQWRALARLWREQAKARNGDAGFKDRMHKLEQHIVKLMLETGSDGHEIVNELETALKFDPDNHELRQQAAEQLMEIGQPKQALKHFEIIEKQQGLSIDLLVRQAEALDLMNRHHDARKMFERALELDPANPTARRGYVIFLGQEAVRADDDDDFDRAIEICERQLSIDPNFKPAMTHLIALYMEMGRKGEAKVLIDRLLADDPQSAQKHVLVGEIYLTAEMKREAGKYFKKAIELDPSAECYYHIGVSYWENGYKKDAFKHFGRAAETANIDMLLEIATNLVDQGEKKEAEGFIKKAMIVDPTHPIPHMIQGLLLLGGQFLSFPSPKDIERAAQEFAEAERLMSGRDEYQDLLSEVRKIKKMFQTGQVPISDPFFDPADTFPFEEDLFFESPPKPTKKKRRK